MTFSLNISLTVFNKRLTAPSPKPCYFCFSKLVKETHIKKEIMKRLLIGFGLAMFLILGAANVNNASAAQDATEIVNFDNPQDDGKSKKKAKKEKKATDKKACDKKNATLKSECSPKATCGDKKGKSCCSSKKEPKK
jgi:hypothetical protein